MAVRPHPPRPRPGSGTAAVLAAAVLAATLAGCAPRLAARPAGHGASGSTPGGRTSTAQVSTPQPASCRRSPASVPAPPVLVLRNASNGEVLCVWTGQRILVFLTGSPQRRWAAVRSDSAALAPAASGEMMLRLGVTGAAFAAARPGIAHLMSARATCASGPVRCDALARFRVTIVVLAR